MTQITRAAAPFRPITITITEADDWRWLKTCVSSAHQRSAHGSPMHRASKRWLDMMDPTAIPEEERTKEL